MLDYAQIALEVGLEGEVRFKYVLYMSTRWKTKQNDYSHAKFWAQKFKSNTEYIWSDSMGRKILANLNRIKWSERFKNGVEKSCTS